MDRGIGELLVLLEQLEIADQTLVIFTSDNGPTYNRLGGSDSDFFKSAGSFRGLKGSIYEGGIRVPLVARWPGKIKAGTETDHISAFQDVLPTLADLAGAEIPENTDGISFAPTLLDHAGQVQHPFLYMEFPSYGGQQMVRMGEWKGVRQNIFRDSLQIELYNLEEDISEKRNVSKEHPEIVKKIEEIMIDARVPSQEFPFRQIDSLSVEGE
jgi:arylsulfatase